MAIKPTASVETLDLRLLHVNLLFADLRECILRPLLAENPLLLVTLPHSSVLLRNRLILLRLVPHAANSAAEVEAALLQGLFERAPRFYNDSAPPQNFENKYRWNFSTHLSPHSEN